MSQSETVLDEEFTGTEALHLLAFFILVLNTNGAEEGTVWKPTIIIFMIMFMQNSDTSSSTSFWSGRYYTY